MAITLSRRNLVKELKSTQVPAQENSQEFVILHHWSAKTRHFSGTHPASIARDLNGLILDRRKVAIEYV